jgi:hypothetical protein
MVTLALKGDRKVVVSGRAALRFQMRRAAFRSYDHFSLAACSTVVMMGEMSHEMIRRDPVRMSAVTPMPDESGILLPSAMIALRARRTRAI